MCMVCTRLEMLGQTGFSCIFSFQELVVFEFDVCIASVANLFPRFRNDMCSCRFRILGIEQFMSLGHTVMN